jgi:hypothetical protein
VSRATHAIARLFRLDHIESVGKRPLHQSGKYRVNKNDEEILGSSRSDAVNEASPIAAIKKQAGRAWRGPLVVQNDRVKIQAWLEAALPSAACAAARRAIGTR